MSGSNLEETLELFGGPLSSERLLRILPDWAVDELQGWIQVAGDRTARILEANDCPNVHIYATNATWTGVRLSPLRDGDMLVTLPVGLLVRLWTAYRLLLEYEMHEAPTMRLVASLEDSPDPNRPTPPRLRPLLRDVDDVEGWWTQMESLDRSVPSHGRDNDAAQLMFTSLETVLNHEVSHILRGHLEIRSAHNGSQEFGITGAMNVERALEIDADLYGGLLLGASRRHQWGAELTNSLTGATISISGLLALFDAKYLRVFDDFESASYYHPKIRRGAYVGGITMSFSEEDQDSVRASLNEGILWFDRAMGQFEMDAFTGGFGQWPKGAGAPIINPLRMGLFQPTYDSDADSADRDVAWVEDNFRARHGPVQFPST